jgi:putative oxidoreductase
MERSLGARWALLPARIVVGIGFLAHGLAKWHRGPEKFAVLLAHIGVPLPLPAAWGTTFVEIAGGGALLAGLYVSVACVPLVATMLVAMFTIHIHYGFSAVNTVGVTATGPQFGPPGYEINLLYMAALAALALAGPTAFSLDAMRMRMRMRHGSS